jgi:hypothetical protein
MAKPDSTGVEPLFETHDGISSELTRYHIFVWGAYQDSGKTHMHFDVRIRDRTPAQFGARSQLRLQEAVSHALGLTMTDVIYMGRTVEYDDNVVIEFELFVGSGSRARAQTIESESRADVIGDTIRAHTFAAKVKQWGGWRMTEHIASLQLSFSKPVVDSSPRHYMLTGSICFVLTLLVTCAISKSARRFQSSKRHRSSSDEHTLPVSMMDLFQFEATVETIEEEMRELTDEI